MQCVNNIILACISHSHVSFRSSFLSVSLSPSFSFFPLPLFLPSVSLWVAPAAEREVAQFSANVIFFVVLPPIILGKKEQKKRKHTHIHRHNNNLIHQHQITHQTPSDGISVFVTEQLVHFFVLCSVCSCVSSPFSLSFSLYVCLFVCVFVILYVCSDAGYTLRRKRFFSSLGTILLYAIVGTIINNLIFGYIMYGFAQLQWIPLNKYNPLECLLFGSLISATDPVATLACKHTHTHNNKQQTTNNTQ